MLVHALSGPTSRSFWQRPRLSFQGRAPVEQGRRRRHSRDRLLCAAKASDAAAHSGPAWTQRVSGTGTCIDQMNAIQLSCILLRPGSSAVSSFDAVVIGRALHPRDDVSYSTITTHTLAAFDIPHPYAQNLSLPGARVLQPRPASHNSGASRRAIFSPAGNDPT